MSCFVIYDVTCWELAEDRVQILVLSPLFYCGLPFNAKFLS